ncbi:UNVERIFIED_CONTAM: hypothetical protein Sindi_1835200 [Sesamum indicum]
MDLYSSHEFCPGRIRKILLLEEMAQFRISRSPFISAVLLLELFTILFFVGFICSQASLQTTLVIRNRRGRTATSAVAGLLFGNLPFALFSFKAWFGRGLDYLHGSLRRLIIDLDWGGSIVKELQEYRLHLQQKQLQLQTLKHHASSRGGCMDLSLGLCELTLHEEGKGTLLGPHFVGDVSRHDFRCYKVQK